ncbi:MAG: efflux transporter outer membrane subunit [Phycisphaerales bacterium]|nr:efflux transporter outer membrane subunit [Phycisphaerales bacterium]
MRRPALAILPLLALAGCRVGPDYQPPKTDVPDAYRFTLDGATGDADAAWWTAFNDPALVTLVEEALRNNRDVRVAALRVEEFAARVGIARSDKFPQVAYGADAAREQISREAGAGKSPSADRVVDVFSANLNVGWELDLWGRVARAEEAARADLLAQVETRRAVVLTLVTAVATSYTALLSLDEQLRIAHQSVETREKTLELFELQLSGGIISRLELEQVRSELERTRATIPTIERNIALVENSLSVLLARPPGPIERTSLDAVSLPAIPAGVPSELLRQRPDLRASEQRLVAANARFGQAIADFYPRLQLTGLLGVASDDLSNLATSSAGIYQLAASVAGPIFTAGRLEGQRDAAEAASRGALEQYLQDILTALRESEDSLVTLSTTRSEFEVQGRQVDALASYAALAQQRYDNGFVGYLEVLDAERDLFDARLQSARLHASLYAASIGVYKAFGGGWIDRADALTSESSEPSETP